MRKPQIFSILNFWILFTCTTPQTLPTVLFNVTIVMDPCASNPCLNGVCTVESYGFYCDCKKYYAGVLCDSYSNDYCSENPCQNNGVCSSVSGKEPYTCECFEPFIGLYCETNTEIIDLNKIDSIEIINIKDDQNQSNALHYQTNNVFLLNQTINLFLSLNKSNSLNSSRLDNISNSLLNISNLRQGEKEETNTFIDIFNECIQTANDKKLESLLNITQKISQNLEAVVSNVNFGSEQVYSKVSSNIAVLSYMINNTSAFSTGFTQSDSQNIELVNNKSQVDFSQVKSSAFLDPRVLNKITNNSEAELVITFAVFKKSTIFDVNTSLIQYSNYNCSNLNNKQIISDVISVSSNIPLKSDSNFVKTLFRPHRNTNKCSRKGLKYVCVYWDYSNNKWNSSGCKHSFAKNNLHVCECNHLTNFAVLMTFDNSLSKCQICSKILEYASCVGSALSICGLLITIFFYSKDLIKKSIKKRRSNSSHFKSMFDYYIQILMSLSFMLLALNVAYIAFSKVTVTTHGTQLCVAIGALMHYILLSSFGWMLCFAVLQYLTFNKVLFVVNNYYIYSAIFSFGFPLIPVTTIVSINWQLYQNSLTNYCWPSGNAALFGVILPILVIVLINLAIFCLILRKHWHLCYTQKNLQGTLRHVKKQSMILTTSFVNMGLTWAMGFLLLIPMENTYVQTGIALVFCFLNSMQGFLLFAVYIILSKSRRALITHSVHEKFQKVKEVFSFNELTARVDTQDTSIVSKVSSSTYYQSNSLDIYKESYDDKQKPVHI